jgi:hypothetical protein
MKTYRENFTDATRNTLIVINARNDYFAFIQWNQTDMLRPIRRVP